MLCQRCWWWLAHGIPPRSGAPASRTGKRSARARLDHEFSVASKHYGVWYTKVILGLPDAVIAAQAGWSEESITKMVATCGHAVDERRLDEIDAAFQVTLR